MIEVTNTPDAEALRFISNGIQSYNKGYLSEDVVYEKDTKFAVFARDENNTVVGGIRANAFWNYCFIELLWLSESKRKEGIGAELLLHAEGYAKKHGFEYMRTETTSFQAKPFYEKHGYTLLGEFPDHPKGYVMYLLIKKL